MRTCPRASTVVRMRVSAARFPTTTRSISSSTATARAVVVAAGMVISESYPPSHLFQQFQNFRERGSTRPGFARTGRRDVVGIHPRPQLRAEKHPSGGVERCRVFGLD